MREGLLRRVQTSGIVYKYCAFILKGVFSGFLMLFLVDAFDCLGGCTHLNNRVHPLSMPIK